MKQYHIVRHALGILRRILATGEEAAAYGDVIKEYARLFGTPPSFAQTCWRMECLLGWNVGHFGSSRGGPKKSYFEDFLLPVAYRYHSRIGIHFPYGTNLVLKNGKKNFNYWSDYFHGYTEDSYSSDNLEDFAKLLRDNTD